MDEEENDLFPEIVVDRKAKEYVATSEEEEEEEDEVEKNIVEEKPEVPKVEKYLPKVRPKKDMFHCEGEDVSKPSPEPEKERRPKKKPSPQQLEHLAKIRVKALESKRKKKAEREASLKASKDSPAKPVKAKEPAASPDKELSDIEVDRLIDRYKQRRKAKKEAKQAEEQAQQLIKSHYAPAEQMAVAKTWSDFF